MNGEFEETKYMIQKTHERNSFINIPDGERVFIDGGAIIVYDENDEVVYSVGPGEWVEIVKTETFKKMFPSADDIFGG